MSLPVGPAKRDLIAPGLMVEPGDEEREPLCLYCMDTPLMQVEGAWYCPIHRYGFIKDLGLEPLDTHWFGYAAPGKD